MYDFNNKYTSILFSAEWWLNYGESAPILRKVAIKVLSQTTTPSNCERNWSTFSLIHTKVRNRLTMQKLNKLVYIHYNIKLRNRQRRREFEDHPDYFCPINLNYIFSENDDVLAQWIEEVEEPVLDHDEQIGDMVQDLTGERPEPMRAAERLREINLTHQRRRGVDPQEMRDEVDDDEDTSLSTTSSSSDVPQDSDGDDGGGDGGEVPPHMMETIEHFPSYGNIDPTRGYRRIVPPTESSHASASGIGYGEGEGTSGGDVGNQQVMYGDYYVLHPHQDLDLPHEFYR